MSKLSRDGYVIRKKNFKCSKIYLYLPELYNKLYLIKVLNINLNRDKCVTKCCKSIQISSKCYIDSNRISTNNRIDVSAITDKFTSHY